MAVGSWSVDESNKNSTFRELWATGLVLKSFAPLLRGKEVLHRTDNKNTEIILSIGSRKSDLHNEAVNIYRLCREFNIRLTVEWISRELNGVADELSRIEDSNDYKLDPSCFAYLDRCLGPHTVDRFASVKTRQLDDFVADSLTLVVKLLMPSLSLGQGITIGCFLHHIWFLMFCARCRMEGRMEPS